MTESSPTHVAHVGLAEDATRSAVEGHPVVTLCGTEIVVSRDPRGLPRCPACLAILERVGTPPPRD